VLDSYAISLLPRKLTALKLLRSGVAIGFLPRRHLIRKKIILGVRIHASIKTRGCGKKRLYFLRQGNQIIFCLSASSTNFLEKINRCAVEMKNKFRFLGLY
jgi:hypothetical protein